MSANEPAETAPAGPDALILSERPEPRGLRAALRELAGEDPTAGRDEAVRRVAAALWRSWRGELGPLGVTAAAFRSAVAGAAREVWLWVMGDRPYEQLQQTIAGRAIRRIGR